MLKKTLRIKFLIITLALLTLISAVNFCIFYLFAPGESIENKTIIIEPNLSIEQIATKLANNRIIKYPFLFKIITKAYSVKNNIKSGEYMFTHNISPKQVLQILSSGKSIVHKMVIPEGTTAYEIVKKINEEERLIGEIKGTVPEGYLMPSTYFFSYGDHKEKLIDQMRKLMSSNIDKVMAKLPENSPLKTRLDVLTLASIVEKETSIDEEKPLVAAVFLNRLKKGMKLQACPTVIYAITEGHFKLTRPLTKKDLSLESPYNTYYVSKLPKGPISCPGLKSLEAVINPAKTTSLYFVVDGKGGHHFSDNFNDHNKHARNYKHEVSLKSRKVE